MEVLKDLKMKLWQLLKSLMLRKLVIVLPLSPLKVVFRTLDAVMICLGSMIGHGFHNTLGLIAERYGIMSVFCFGLGGLIMIIIAMCYAELSCLSPTAGNAYHYSYNTMGELFGFLVGWLMILSYSLDLILATRYLSSFIDHSFFDEKIGIASKENLTRKPLESYEDIFNPQPDILSVLIILVVASRTISLAKESILVTNILTAINLLTVFIIAIIYIFSINYPKTKDHLIPKDLSNLSFMYEGVFYAHYCFTGYDAAVCLGEETINATTNIPKSIMFASKASVIIYCSVSILHCLVWPVNDVDPQAPFVYIMSKLQHKPISWLCAFASVIGHLSSAHACMFLLTRLLYTMSRDGLIFNVFGHINRNTNTPIISTFIFTVILGMYLRNEYMWTIARASGNISKEVIAICLLIRRYRCEDNITENDPLNRWVLINYPRSLKNPSKETERISMLLIGIAVLCLMASGIFFRILIEDAHLSHPLIRIGLVMSLVLFFLFGFCLMQQPQNKRNTFYTIRGVPFIPLSIVGILEIMGWDSELYPRKEIFIWLFLGLIFYFIYSHRHSIERSFLYPDGKRWERLQTANQIERHIVNILPDPADPTYIKFIRAHRRRNVKSNLFHDKVDSEGFGETELTKPQTATDSSILVTEPSMDEASNEDLDARK